MDLIRQSAGLQPLTATAPQPARRFNLDSYPGHDALYLGLTSENASGESVNEATAMGVTAVYRCVALIAGTIASLPLKYYRTTPEGDRERLTNWMTDTPGGPGGPTRFEWIETLLSHLLLHGEAFGKILRAETGATVGVQWLHPAVCEVTEHSTPLNKRFRIQTNGGVREYGERDILHIPAISLDGIRGVSPIGAARLAFGTAIAGDKAAGRMFNNGLLLGGIASPKEPLDDKQLEALAAGLRSKLAGGKRAGDVAVVNADLEFHPWSMNAHDAQFIESRGFQVAEISRIYGVPKVLLSEDGASTWGTGIAEIIRGMSRFTLAPWTTRVEERLSRLVPASRIVEFDYSGLLQPSPEVELDNLLKQKEAGILSVDEIRRIRNLPPVGSPGGTSNE